MKKKDFHKFNGFKILERNATIFHYNKKESAGLLKKLGQKLKNLISK